MRPRPPTSSRPPPQHPRPRTPPKKRPLKKKNRNNLDGFGPPRHICPASGESALMRRRVLLWNVAASLAALASGCATSPTFENSVLIGDGPPPAVTNPAYVPLG